MKIKDETLGMWLGVLGVAFFAVTLPMTRLATGTTAAPQLSPGFVTVARAALAGALSLVFLLATRSPWPRRHEWKPLAMAVLGNCLGFPLLLGYALRVVTASHAAVITALLPLATAAIAAWVLHQRARLGFWVCAVIGSFLVVAFSTLRASQGGNGFGLELADLLLVGAVIAASIGYVYGAQVTPSLGAERVICWVCVMALPVTLPAALVLWPQQPVATSAWAALVYVGVFSMWLGFFAWYRGLALGGALRVSQTQLLQPFLSILAAVPLAGRSARHRHAGLCRCRRGNGDGRQEAVATPRHRASFHRSSGFMNPDLLIAFALFACVTSITPGPNNTMILASGVNFGLRRSVRHLLGISLGFGVMVAATGFGLHALFERHPALFDAMRWPARPTCSGWHGTLRALAARWPTALDDVLRPMGFFARLRSNG